MWFPWKTCLFTIDVFPWNGQWNENVPHLTKSSKGKHVFALVDMSQLILLIIWIPTLLLLLSKPFNWFLFSPLLTIGISTQLILLWPFLKQMSKKTFLRIHPRCHIIYNPRSPIIHRPIQTYLQTPQELIRPKWCWLYVEIPSQRWSY